MSELPPAHEDTPQQKRALRSNRTAKRVRERFPRGTRVEATNDMGETGNGNVGTVVAHIPALTSLGGHLKVLWDEPSPFTGKPVVSRMLAPSLRVVGPVQRVAARDVHHGDLIEGRAVAYNVPSASARAQRIIRFEDGGSWIAHHAEKLALVRPDQAS